MDNTDDKLVEKYNRVYGEGENKFWTVSSIEEQMCILQNIDFYDKTVLEIGCGTGDMAYSMMRAGALSVDAYDLSAEAIDHARQKYLFDGLSFIHGDPCAGDYHRSEAKTYDIIVMIGTLEHVENPVSYLTTVISRFTAPGSALAISCPMFINPRGYIWMTLKTLFDAPMSLTDKHELEPDWFKSFADTSDPKVSIENVETVDMDWGCGKRMVMDFRRRLPKVFPDMDPERIKKLLFWLTTNIGNHAGHGANGVYFLKRD